MASIVETDAFIYTENTFGNRIFAVLKNKGCQSSKYPADSYSFEIKAKRYRDFAPRGLIGCTFMEAFQWVNKIASVSTWSEN